jgi:hypothetical protein
MGEFCLDHEREDQPLDLVLLARAVEEAEPGGAEEFHAGRCAYLHACATDRLALRAAFRAALSTMLALGDAAVGADVFAV